MPEFDLLQFIRKYSVVVANIYNVYLFFGSGFSGTCSNLVDGDHWGRGHKIHWGGYEISDHVAL